MNKSVLTGILALTIGLYGGSLSAQQKADTSKQRIQTLDFVAYDTPPSPVGGYDAIKQHVVYADSARKAGIEGTIFIQAYISKTGKALDLVIASDSLGYGLEQSAMNAIESVDWKPASHKEKFVGTWVTIPIQYRLK